MAVIRRCPERCRPSQDSFIVRLFVGFQGFFTFFFFFNLGPDRFYVGECLGAEGISRQRDEVVPGDDTHCADLRANGRAGEGGRGVKGLCCQQGKAGEKTGKWERGVY